MKQTSLALLDSDVCRRARVTHALMAMKLHVEPYESTSEISPDWDGADAILVHDEPGALAEVMNLMCDTERWIHSLVYAEAPVPSQIVRAVHEGASDYLAWPFSVVDLDKALQRAGEQSEKIASSKRKELLARKLITRLTLREVQVLEGMATGMSNREIGSALDISVRTVEVHRANLLKRMSLHHTSDAIRIAIEAGIEGLAPVQPPATVGEAQFLSHLRFS